MRLSVLALCVLTAVSFACGPRHHPSWTVDGEPPRESLVPDMLFGGEAYVLEAGADDAPPLVFIHGLGSQGASDFDRILPQLAAHHHVIAFDLPGFARSSRGHAVYSPAQYVRFIKRIVTPRVRGPFDVVGHSMGGAFAIALAGTYPRSVRRLALLDVAGVLHRDVYSDTVVRELLSPQGDAWDPLRLGSVGLYKLIRKPMAQLEIEAARIARDDDLRNAMSSSQIAALMMIEHDFGPDLRRVRAPIFLGWGAHDAVAPQRTAALLRYLLRPVVYQTFEHSAHTPMKTEPEEVASALEAFFSMPELSPSPEVPIAPGTRPARCEGEQGAVFEGQFDVISLVRCKRAVLRNVRARSLIVMSSSAELENVALEGAEVGVTIDRSRLIWTGGEIRAGVCIDGARSKLDVAGVTCMPTQKAVTMRGPTRVVASVSELRMGDHVQSVHGVAVLGRNQLELPLSASR